MRLELTSVLLGVSIFTAAAVAEEARFDQFATLALEDGYASEELGAGDWSKAEEALLGGQFAPEDEVFAKLNLAFVYSTTGRRDQAVAIYNEILSGRENPYALLLNGEPRRVKTIAKTALKKMSQ